MSGTTHKSDCKMSFGRKDATCPRCQELLAGAEPVKWTSRSREAKRVEALLASFAKHDCKARGCGPVCTWGEW